MFGKKGELDIPFGWLFGLIVGAMILSLAIFMATKIMTQEQTKIDASFAKEIGVLMNPLQIGAGDSRSGNIKFAVDTQLYLTCEEYGDFGKQKILVSQKSFGNWTSTGVEVSFNNLHIFSKSLVEGKNFILMPRKFEFPYKITELMILIPKTERYCFVDAPDNVVTEVQNWDLSNVVMNCSDGDIKVCFEGSSGCDISVKYNEGIIQHPEGRIYFSDDDLMYAGIFSDVETYECQLKRLMKKTASLAMLYRDKYPIIAKAGCSSNLNNDLVVFSSSLNSLESSNSIKSLATQAKTMGEKNNAKAECRLW